MPALELELRLQIKRERLDDERRDAALQHTASDIARRLVAFKQEHVDSLVEGKAIAEAALEDERSTGAQQRATAEARVAEAERRAADLEAQHAAATAAGLREERRRAAELAEAKAVAAKLRRDAEAAAQHKDCCICLEHPSAYALTPCGHKVICSGDSCYDMIVANGCPICRAVVKGKLRVFD